MELHPISDTREGDPLRTKYYCQVDKSQNMNVVMELKATKQENLHRTSLRYVLVIDVSDSMNELVGIGQRSLLQRVQLFAELAVRKMSQRDFLAIVTFAESSIVELPMTRMTPNNKQMARNILKRLYSRGITNLDSGLMAALEVIKSASPSRASRDCIILFTDGEANAGETDPIKLIAKYHKVQANMNRKSCVPVSAFTIGTYHPDMLIEISRQLGSESFYWLNDEEDFEADMLIPLFLREITNITDVDIKIESTKNSYFDVVGIKPPYLTGTENHTVKVKRKKKKRPTKLFYFIHSLPDECTKNISFHLFLPQALDGLRVVDITVHYLNTDMERCTIQDYILVSTKSLMVSRNQDLGFSTGAASLAESMREVSAFIVASNQAGTSWKEAQDVIIKVAEEKCKLASVNSIAKAKMHTRENTSQAHECFRNCFETINMIRDKTECLLPDNGDDRVKRLTDDWMKRVSYANDVVASQNPRNYSKLSSMESSICTESPTSGGVFKDKQPYMSDILEEKLLEEKKNLEVARRLQAGPEITFSSVKVRVNRAIGVEDLETMEKCLEDLKALALFDEEVEDKFSEYVKKEVEHRIQLEKIKKDLSVSMADEDLPATEDLVSRMKELRNKTDLTFSSGDANALQTALNAIAVYRRKRGLRAEIASNMPALNLPIVPENVEKISEAIGILVKLRHQAKDFEDVFTRQDSATLNVAIANLGEAKKRMDAIARRLKELTVILSLPEYPYNSEAIKDAISEMQEAKQEAEQYPGLFGEREELILKTSCDNSESLMEERRGLAERIQRLIPTLEMPMLPRNYAMLSEGVEQMIELRRRGSRFKDLFLPEHDAVLNQASANVALLLSKREELSKKIDGCILNASLPKLPANLNKLKSAVNIMSEVRDEAKGFENVFTEEHAQLLHTATASTKILETEKSELEKEEEEVITTLQLPMLAANYRRICQGVELMKRIAPDLKGFGLYKDEYDFLLKKAIFNRDVLDDKRKEISKDLEKLKPRLKVTLLPENLASLRDAVEKMKTLKEESRGFDDVFKSTHESDLFEATADLKQLTKKVETMQEARMRLEEAVGKRNFIRLKHAVKKASRAPFISKDELKEPRKLLAFLDPKERRSALNYAMEHQEIEEIEEALLEMKEARVNDEALENRAREILKRLRKQKRREEKERRRIEREKARRARELKKIEGNLLSAIESREIEDLEQALGNYEISEFSESDISCLGEAKELLEHLKIEELRNRLVNAVKRRNIDAIYNALMDANHEGYVEHMRKEYDAAENLLIHLLEMMRLREEITKMTRASLSEVHSYPKPPKAIHKIMRAIFIILGEAPKELKEWTKIQALMGRLDRNSITKRVGRFRIRDVSFDTAQMAEKFLNNLDLEEVEGVSRVASTLYAWAKYVVKEIAHLREENERKERERKEAEQEDDYDGFESDEEKSSKRSSEEDHTEPNESNTDDAGDLIATDPLNKNKPSFILGESLS